MPVTQETELETIALDIQNSVATITLNRPDKYNAINYQMHRDLTTALKQIKRSSEARSLLITGRGKGFCAGQDLGEFAVAKASEDFRVDEHVRSTFNRTITTIRELEIPVIAAVNGVAAGAGWSFALAADIRIASEDASFTQAFSKIGLIPDTGSTWFLPELIGTSRSLELMLTGDPIDAQKALDWGLVNFVVPAAELEEFAKEYAVRLAQMPTKALGLTKRAVYRAVNTTFADAIEYEAQLQQYVALTSDHTEGVMAFIEKRKPVFTGK